KRFCCFLGVAAFFLSSSGSIAVGRFDQKLSTDKQATHVLNRLTFGARPGDTEQIRRMSVEKWIDLQLHPDRIVENPILETKLKPLQTLQLANWELLQKYPPMPPAFTLKPVTLPLLPPPQMAKLLNCSAEERIATLGTFDSETRRLLLIAAPPQLLEG